MESLGLFFFEVRDGFKSQSNILTGDMIINILKRDGGGHNSPCQSFSHRDLAINSVGPLIDIICMFGPVEFHGGVVPGLVSV